ncbi:nitrous oxide-stimulated promoter family protein [Neobacillus vireti]|uniref:nitrous oxide-stimulated promoter family protein n=1 Tax=Neobacillus vireti TaxID=220686 RepID=UPI0030003F12
MKRQLNNGLIVQKEKEIVTEMINLYCKKKHHQQQEVCKDCHNLKTYALMRLSLCRFGEEKSACSNCTVHCYKPNYRLEMKKVMRYSGPWMMLYHPVYAVKHLLNKPKTQLK